MSDQSSGSHADNRLRALLADVGLAAIRDHRLANAAAIEAARQRLNASRQAEAFTLLTVKPVAAWTAEDHILFMDAIGERDTSTPAPAEPVQIRTTPGAFARRIDDEIPF